MQLSLGSALQMPAECC